MARHRIVTLTLDGTPYPMRLDMNTAETIQELAGQNVLGGQLDVSPKTLKVILFAALDAAARAQGKEAPLSMDQIGSLIDPTDVEQMGELTQAIERLFGTNTVQPEDVPKADPTSAPTAEASPSPSSAAIALPGSSLELVTPSSGG